MSENSQVDSLLGATARWTAAVRAMESAREDRLFDDPWATALAGEVGAAWGEARSTGSVVPIVIRTLSWPKMNIRSKKRGFGGITYPGYWR